MLGKNKKLGLNKETVRALSGNEMQGLVGGFAFRGAYNLNIAACTANCDCTKTCNTCGCTKFNFNIAINPGY